VAAGVVGELLSKGKRVVFVTGAGLSAASGLPVYRHAPDAIWETSLKEWGTRAAFARDARAWWSGYRSRGYESLMTAKPNKGHDAVAAVAQRFPTACVVTQNVDGLHCAVPPQQRVEVHGTAHRLKCINAGCPHASTTTVSAVLAPPLHNPGEITRSSTDVGGGTVADERKAIAAAACEFPDGAVAQTQRQEEDAHGLDPPCCPLCGGPLCAAFLLFDEDYESHAMFEWDKVLKWFADAEAFVFVGTSFAVGDARPHSQPKEGVAANGRKYLLSAPFLQSRFACLPSLCP
jgi:NAD-dependent SIR2 family protein deacetylase